MRYVFIHEGHAYALTYAEPRQVIDLGLESSSAAGVVMELGDGHTWADKDQTAWGRLLLTRESA